MVRVTEAEWALRREVLVRFEASGLSLAGFSKREGIAYTRLLAWQKRLGVRDARSEILPVAPQPSSHCSQPPAAPLFTELVRVDGAVSQGAPVEIVLAGGVVIRLHRGADAELLRTAIEAVKACS